MSAGQSELRLEPGWKLPANAWPASNARGDSGAIAAPVKAIASLPVSAWPGHRTRLKKYDFGFLTDAHKHSSCHHCQLEESDLCGCFYCLRVYQPREIRKWCDRGEDRRDYTQATALCPHCGIDSVLFSSSGLPVGDDEFLQAMHDRWFELCTGWDDEDHDEEGFG
ncbi:MAG: hypothetical protein R3F46_08240 [bacterium]